MSYPNPDTVLFHARHVLRYIEREIGEHPTRDARRLAVLMRHPTDRDGWSLWAADSILDGLTHVAIDDRQEQLYALRCLLQAREYRGNCGGFLAGGLSDSLVVLQNAVENAISGVTHPDRAIGPMRVAARAAVAEREGK